MVVCEDLVAVNPEECLPEANTAAATATAQQQHSNSTAQQGSSGLISMMSPAQGALAKISCGLSQTNIFLKQVHIQ